MENAKYQTGEFNKFIQMGDFENNELSSSDDGEGDEAENFVK